MVDFLVAKPPVCRFSPGKIVLNFVTKTSPKLHQILHTEVHNKQRNLSPSAHSGAISRNKSSNPLCPRSFRSNMPCTTTRSRERKSAPSFSARSFFGGHGRLRVRVMDVHTQMLVFPRFRGPEVFDPGRPRE